MKLLALALSLLLATGCAVLKIEPPDPAPLKVTKGIVRVPLCLLTFCWSESIYFLQQRRFARCDRSVASWVGAHVDHLRLAYGNPSELSEDMAGSGFTVHYVYTQSISLPGQWTSNASHTSGQWSNPSVIRNELTRSFHVNHDGLVDSYAWRGYRAGEPRRDAGRNF